MTEEELRAFGILDGGDENFDYGEDGEDEQDGF